MLDFDSIQAAAQADMQANPGPDNSARGPTASASGGGNATATAPAQQAADAPRPGQNVEMTVGPDGLLRESGEQPAAAFTPITAPPPVLVPVTAETPPPTSPATPTPPAATPPATPPPAQPPAPAAQPPPAQAQTSEDMARNFRIQAKSQVDQLALHLVKQNPTLGLLEASVQAHQTIGLSLPPQLVAGAAPAAAASPASPAPQAAPATPVQSPDQIRAAEISARLDQIEADIAGLDPIVDSARTAELAAENRKLTREFAQVEARLQATQLLQAQQSRQQAALTMDQQIEANYRQAIATYPELAQDDSAMAVQFDAEIARLQNTNDPLLQSPDCEILVASHVAQKLGLLPASLRPSAAPTTPAPGPATSPPAAPSAAAPSAPAAQPGLAPVTAAPALPGHLGQAADRVTHVPAAPSQVIVDLNQQYAQATQLGDFEKISELNRQGLLLGAGVQAGQAPPQPAGHTSLSLVF